MSSSSMNGFFNPNITSNFLENGTLCGTLHPLPAFYSNGSVLTVKFKTDLDVQANGFAAEYQQDSCYSNPCQNGGTCYNRQDACGFTCACVEGYEGDVCEKPEPPTVTPPDVNVTEGDNITYTCVTILSGVVEYQWFKNGVQITGQTASTYSFIADLTNNNDNFTCSVTIDPDEQSDPSDPVSPTVRPDPPTVIQPGVNVTEGDNITYTCVYTVSPPSQVVEYQWFKNGVKITGQSASTYSFIADLTNNNDNYTCSVTTDPGGTSEESDPVSPTVRPDPPTVIQPGVNVTEGDNITYTCVYIVSPPSQVVEYQWFKNGVKITGQSASTYSFIADLTNNNDNYTCSVTTDPGGTSEESDPVSPIVRPDPPTVIQPGVNVTEGDNITYTCVYTVSPPSQVVEYQWFKNGVPINGQTASTYSFIADLTNNNDNYTCSVTTDPGGTSEESDPVSPTVRPDPPTVIPPGVNVTDGDNITYTCVYIVSPPSQVEGYQWFKNGVPINGQTASTYSFIADLTNNNDNYTCSVTTDPGGTSDQSDPVSPTVRTQTPEVIPEDVDVTYGTPVNYTCNTTYSDDQITEFEWFVNGTVITGENDRFYLFIAFTNSSASNYTCRVTTVLGGPSEISDSVSPNVTCPIHCFGYECQYNTGSCINRCGLDYVLDLPAGSCRCIAPDCFHHSQKNSCCSDQKQTCS
ncbi:B-cell receptor CD22-like [Babylonia areolata]|uniref:B-cell receptor CD22-like n=1 Tax=Babylonia areolata TaxID=304850 RepID=UPI003FD2DC6F